MRSARGARPVVQLSAGRAIPTRAGHAAFSPFRGYDHKDNVHWFKAQTDPGFIFNIHVMGYNRENPRTPRRVYVDPDGEKVAGGLIVAKKISAARCHEKYG